MIAEFSNLKNAKIPRLFKYSSYRILIRLGDPPYSKPETDSFFFRCSLPPVEEKSASHPPPDWIGFGFDFANPGLDWVNKCNPIPTSGPFPFLHVDFCMNPTHDLLPSVRQYYFIILCRSIKAYLFYILPVADIYSKVANRTLKKRHACSSSKTLPFIKIQSLNYKTC